MPWGVRPAPVASCGAGHLIRSSWVLVRTLVSWDRLVAVQLVED